MHNNLESLIKDVDLALREICSKRGINYEESELKEKNGVISIKSKMSLFINGNTVYQNDYLHNCNYLGLDPLWLFKKATYKSRTYEILGYYSKRTRNSIKVRNTNSNSEFYLHPDDIRKIWVMGCIEK